MTSNVAIKFRLVFRNFYQLYWFFFQFISHCKCIHIFSYFYMFYKMYVKWGMFQKHWMLFLTPTYKLQFLIENTCYYFNQECGDFFLDRIGKTMLKRMYVLRSSVLNIDWNIFLMYYLNNYLFLFYIVICT
jgi:hypothetical protein